MDPFSGSNHWVFVGIYHHPAPTDSPFHSVEVKDTYLNEATAFVSAYVAKSALFLRKLPIPPPE